MAVRFKLDETLPRDAAPLLRDAGHDVHTVIDEKFGGESDPRVLDASRAETRVLITFDLDFSDIRLYPSASHSGVWVLRPRTQSIDNTLVLLTRALMVLETESVHGRLWILEPGQVRIRE